MSSPPWTNSWDETKPADTDLANTIGVQARRTKLDVRQRADWQHVWGQNVNDDGGHRNIIIAPAYALANLELMKAAGYSLTGAAVNPMLDLAGTWNTSGAPTAVRVNVTDSGSAASSLLMDLQVGGVSKFSVSKTGQVVTALPFGGILVQQVFMQDNLQDVISVGGGPFASTLGASITLQNISHRLVVGGSFYASAGVTGPDGSVTSSNIFIFRSLNGGAYSQVAAIGVGVAFSRIVAGFVIAQPQVVAINYTDSPAAAIAAYKIYHSVSGSGGATSTSSLVGASGVLRHFYINEIG